MPSRKGSRRCAGSGARGSPRPSRPWRPVASSAPSVGSPISSAVADAAVVGEGGRSQQSIQVGRCAALVGVDFADAVVALAGDESTAGPGRPGCGPSSGSWSASRSCPSRSPWCSPASRPPPSRRTMARCWAMRCTPMARVTVTTAGSPSGIAATASAMEVSTISRKGVAARDTDGEDDRRSPRRR